MMNEECIVISSYSRAQALEDGMLVDVTPIAKEAGFSFAVALTCEANAVLKPSKHLEEMGQSYMGRLWDCVYMLHLAIKGRIPSKTCEGPGPGQTVLYRFICQHGKKKYCEMKAVCGPGDNMEPTITIMLPHED